MQGADFTSGYANATTSAQSVIDVFAESLANNIQFVLLVAIVGAAVWIVRYVALNFQNICGCFGRKSRHGRRQASMYVQEAMFEYSNTLGTSTDYKNLRAKTTRVGYDI